MASLSLPANPADAAMPADIRLMNGVASGLFVLVGVALCVAGLMWLARAPWFTIRVIQLEGDLQRNSVATIRANAMPQLAGNFFSIDLDKARAAFESVPWVRQAVVRRIWPNRLAVRLEEHRAVALWQGRGRRRAAGQQLRRGVRGQPRRRRGRRPAAVRRARGQLGADAGAVPPAGSRCSRRSDGGARR